MEHDEPMLRLIWPGVPRTKKNSQRIVRHGARHFVIPSEAFEAYRSEILIGIPPLARIAISLPVNICCVYYMPTRRKVDEINSAPNRLHRRLGTFCRFWTGAMGFIRVSSPSPCILCSLL